MKKQVDSILVSIDFSHGGENNILLVGKKPPRKPVEIINAFRGE